MVHSSNFECIYNSINSIHSLSFAPEIQKVKRDDDEFNSRRLPLIPSLSVHVSVHKGIYWFYVPCDATAATAAAADNWSPAAPLVELAEEVGEVSDVG